MMDIELELQTILMKYNYGNGKKKKRADIYVLVEDLMRRVASMYKNIAIRCGGNHAAYLLDEFDDFLHVKYVIDKNPSGVIPYIIKKGIPVIRSIEKEEIDVVIIGTFEYRKEIKKELKDSGIYVIDIYDYLEKKGYILEEEFYNAYAGTCVYKEIIEKRNLYTSAKTYEKKYALLKELIGLYFDDKDICTALRCLEEYIHFEYPDYQQMKLLKKEIENLLEEIHQACLARDKRDIMWFWQDGMPFDMVKEMPFFSEYSKKGLFFEKAYSVTSSTRFVYSRILDEQEEYEVCSEKKNMAGHHIAMDLMEDCGYLCQKVTGVRRRPINLSLYDTLITRRLMIADSALTEIYWEALRELLLSDKPVLLLLHTGLETHNPVMAPNLKEYHLYGTESLADRFSKAGLKNYLERLRRTVKYVDYEMKFFFDLMGDQIVKIVMSDHGDIRLKNANNCTESASHIVMAAIGGQLPARRFERLFSLTKFRQLLAYIVGRDIDENELFLEEMKIGTVDAYNKGFIEDLIKIGCICIGLAGSGVLTAKECYFVFRTGEEIYFLRPDDTTNYIAGEQYAARIQYLRDKTQHRFIDITKNSMFKDSYLLYEALGKTADK